MTTTQCLLIFRKCRLVHSIFAFSLKPTTLNYTVLLVWLPMTPAIPVTLSARLMRGRFRKHLLQGKTMYFRSVFLDIWLTMRTISYLFRSPSTSINCINWITKMKAVILFVMFVINFYSLPSHEGPTISKMFHRFVRWSITTSKLLMLRSSTTPRNTYSILKTWSDDAAHLTQSSWSSVFCR